MFSEKGPTGSKTETVHALASTDTYRCIDNIVPTSLSCLAKEEQAHSNVAVNGCNKCETARLAWRSSERLTAFGV